LARLPKVDRERLVEAIDLLCDTPAAASALKGEFEGLRRPCHMACVPEARIGDQLLVHVGVALTVLQPEP
jgi:hydrogenase maturation factor